MAQPNPLPETVEEHESAVRLENVPKNVSWLEYPLRKSPPSQANREQYLLLGMLDAETIKLETEWDMLTLVGAGFMSGTSLLAAQRAVADPVWQSLLTSLQLAQPSGIQDLYHFCVCTGSRMARAAGLSEGPWQPYLSLLGHMWTPPNDFMKAHADNTRLDHYVIPPFEETRSELNVVSAAAVLMSMINQTKVADAEHRLLWTAAQFELKSANDYTTRLDGGLLLNHQVDKIVASAEFKRTKRRACRPQIQEGLEIAMCLKHRLRDVWLSPFLHVSQDADEIYLRFTQPTANYLGFLHNDKHKLTELSAGDYLSVYTFGPFHVWNDDELRRLIIILLAFRSDMKRIVETSPTDWFRLRRNNCCNSHAAPLQAHE